MCLIIFAYDYHPKYKLVVTANRDEYYSRPTLPAHFWEENPQILAGKDLKEGGTWMGINNRGYFAALTNYRDPASNKENAPSRGHLVKNYLESSIEPETYLAGLIDKSVYYNGFNLLLGTKDSLYYYSNREKAVREIASGIHGLSNGLLNEPWPKVTKGINMLAEILKNEEVEMKSLFAMMTDREQFADELLPSTGVSLEWERILAPLFVISPGYGTRVTTVILVDRNNNIKFGERTYMDRQPDKWKEVYYEIRGTD